MSAEELNIQNEVQKIHAKFGTTEKANYEIQLLAESYAREYHAKEMERVLEEAEKKIENLPLGKDSRSYHGATWLLNHLKEDKG